MFSGYRHIPFFAIEFSVWCGPAAKVRRVWWLRMQTLYAMCGTKVCRRKTKATGEKS
jgi:hypothetical protein